MGLRVCKVQRLLTLLLVAYNVTRQECPSSIRSDKPGRYTMQNDTQSAMTRHITVHSMTDETQHHYT